MVEACLRNRVHYLDITGEIEVMEMLAARDEAARTAAIMIMTGTGFDVVPSDCVALHLKNRLPSCNPSWKNTGNIAKPTPLVLISKRR